MWLEKLFGKKKKKPVVDFVTATMDDKRMAMMNYLKESGISTIYFWFPSTEEWLNSQVLPQMPHLQVMPVKNISSTFAEEIVIAEHYLYLPKELELFERSAAKKIIIFSSLDEPLFTLFGSDRIRDLISRMGFSAGEVITHSMITTSIQSAQKKLSEQITYDTGGASPKDWIEKNYRAPKI